jgi:hypothetical protein
VGKWDDWALDDACERGRTWVNFPKYNTTQMQPHERAQGFTDVSDCAARLEREARRNGQPMTRAAPRASLLLAFCLLASAATAHAECAWGLWKQASVKNPAETFPPSAVTTQDKIDWLTAEADLAAQAVDAEAEKPLPQQRETLYRATLACGADLIRLINTIAERLPRLEARVNETMTRTIGGLERIANGRLKIGMSAEQVRQIRGEPSGISEMTTAVGVRQQWQYGATVLLFNNGKLVEIRQMLNE